MLRLTRYAFALVALGSFAFAALFIREASAQAIAVTDAAGRDVRLARPATRIVSLAPHLTELLFAAGAGKRVAGAVDFSDYPPEARALPRVGSFANFDLEAIAALKPELVLAWKSGSRAGQLERLTALGVPVYIEEPGTLDDIARDIEIFGLLAGSADVAREAARDFRARLAELRQRYSSRPRVRAFYQVWHQPLLTVSDRHLIGAVIVLCGGENVFGALGTLTPAVSTEAVLAARPEVIVASGMDEARPEWLDQWRRWPALKATAADNLFFVPPDLLQRHTPRLLDGARLMCEQFEQARARRASTTTNFLLH
ncbi:MAG: cobalamin-binding protein [Azoarcus sp.]|jgi:iron complex transport system substrate-binding protein|nr:cobalamin-binding protein [Azoarcus sp.]